MNRPAFHRTIAWITGIMLAAGIPARSPAQDTTMVKGKIEIIQDERIPLLVSKHIQLNLNRKGTPGYRIQIFFDSGANSKSRAQSIYASFQSRFPETEAYLTYKAPNYKVRVGDFRTKLDARRFLNNIIGDYPNAWIVEDIINLPSTE